MYFVQIRVKVTFVQDVVDVFVFVVMCIEVVCSASWLIVSKPSFFIFFKMVLPSFQCLCKLLFLSLFELLLSYCNFSFYNKGQPGARTSCLRKVRGRVLLEYWVL
jgi:hypothetical protein